jgi:hypothetical protein
MSKVIELVMREILFEDFETAKKIAKSHGCRLSDYDPETGDVTIEHGMDAMRLKAGRKLLQEAVPA